VVKSLFGDKVVLSSQAGSATFNDATLPGWPAGAIHVGIDGLDGWRSTAKLRVGRAPRGVGDGAILSSRFPMVERTIIVEGWIHASSRLLVDQLFDQVVNNAFPADVDIILTVNEPVPKYVTCRLADSVEPTQYLPQGLRWQTTLVCADPLKYDASNTISAGPVGVSGVATGGRTYPRLYPLVYNVTANGTGNQMVVFNAGTTKTYPVITIHGPIPSGWRVENSTTGEYAGFSTDIGISDTVVIDSQHKTATLNGSGIPGLIVGNWFGLVQGSNTLRLFGNYDPAANFSLTAKSAWR
jgi:hypothetical protein